MTSKARLYASLRTIGTAAVGCVLIADAAEAATLNLEVASADQEIVGSTASISGSGNKSNTTTWSIGDTARFQMTGDDGTPAANPVEFGLQVEARSASGSLAPGTDSLMIAQTVNSQGLTDDGTISIYFSPDGSGQFSSTLRFSLFDSGFGTLQSEDMYVTSLDIDFNQIMSVPRSKVVSYGLNNPTDISVTDSGGTLSFTGPGNASFGDPEAAVSLQYIDTSTFDLTFTHSSVALYMLEFRNPPDTVATGNFVTTTVPIPLPAAGWLLLSAAGGLVALRARRSAA